MGKCPLSFFCCFSTIITYFNLIVLGIEYCSLRCYYMIQIHFRILASSYILCLVRLNFVKHSINLCCHGFVFYVMFFDYDTNILYLQRYSKFISKKNGQTPTFLDFTTIYIHIYVSDFDHCS